MTMRYGFIGCGNMGGAVARAVCKGAGAGEVLLANRTVAKAEALAAELGCQVGDNARVARECSYIFLGVKPQMMEDMLDGIADILSERQPPFVLVTMAAGLSMARIRQMAGDAYPIIRIMPNTPVAVGAGMVQYCAKDVEPEQLESGSHPGVLKDAVCSPGGSTVQGVRVLEERAFRGAVMDAVLAAFAKTREMGKG